MEETNINIRQAVEQDKNSISIIANENSGEVGYVSYGEIMDGILRTEVLVAELDSRVIGFLIFYTRKDKYLTLYSIATKKTYRRRNIGTLLIDRLISEAKKYKIKGIRIKCPADINANIFYQRKGFKKVG